MTDEGESKPLTRKEKCNETWEQMWRTKKFKRNVMETPLKRCLTTLDLTLLSMGNMAGAGIYIITGPVVRSKAGDATCVSYFLAGITAMLNGMCYAELSARIPKAGSAYTYTYITGGEFIAFVIGWSVILEYVLCASSVARGWSGTLNTLSNNWISQSTMYMLGVEKESDFPVWMGVPDVCAFILIMSLACILACGPKLSVSFNTVVTSINLAIVVLATSIMFYYADWDNWVDNGRSGEFWHFGATGVMAGAATCFYSFLGFDVVTISSEEAKTPAESLPRAIGLSIGILIFLLVAVASALTLYIPWYDVNEMSPLPGAFATKGVIWAEYITGVGAMMGITGALFCAMYGLPRVVYAMATDGLIFKFLGYVYPRTQVPIIAIFIFSLFAAILSLILSLRILADCLSIGTLIAYTLVNINVVALRYDKRKFDRSDMEGAEYTKEENEYMKTIDTVGLLKGPFVNLPVVKNQPRYRLPVVGLLGSILCAILMVTLTLEATMYLMDWWAICLLVIIVLGYALCLFLMLIHKQNLAFRTYKVPIVPVFPVICITLNIILIYNLDVWTWVRFFSWLFIGMLIYFLYGTKHSVMNLRNAAAAEEVDVIDEKPPDYHAIEDGGLQALPTEEKVPLEGSFVGSSSTDDKAELIP